jgi:hypothetical protein
MDLKAKDMSSEPDSTISPTIQKMKATIAKPNVPPAELSKRAWQLARELATESGDSPKAHFKKAYEAVKTRALEMKIKRRRRPGGGRKSGMTDRVVQRKLDALYAYAQRNYPTWGQYVIETVDRSEAEAELREKRTTTYIIKSAKSHYVAACEAQACAW